MLRFQTVSVMALCVLTAGLSSAVNAQSNPPDQDKSPGGRYYAQLATAKAEIDAQKKQLEQYSEMNEKWVQWFDGQAALLRSYNTAVERQRSRLQTLKDGWNTRVNPTCDNGHTYADCSCNDGRRGKSAYRDLFARQADALEQVVRAGNVEVATYKRTRVAYDSFFAQKNQANAAYNNAVRNYNELSTRSQAGSKDSGGLYFDENAPRKSGAPDSIGEIEKRAREQNKK